MSDFLQRSAYVSVYSMLYDLCFYYTAVQLSLKRDDGFSELQNPTGMFYIYSQGIMLGEEKNKKRYGQPPNSRFIDS